LEPGSGGDDQDLVGPPVVRGKRPEITLNVKVLAEVHNARNFSEDYAIIADKEIRLQEQKPQIFPGK
jgi:hypothetical protein